MYFSYSFERAEDNSIEIWRYNLYNLYQEYYAQVWVAPPFNLLWYLIKLMNSFLPKGRHCDGGHIDSFGIVDDLFCKNSFLHQKLKPRLKYYSDKKKPETQNMVLKITCMKVL